MRSFPTRTILTTLLLAGAATGYYFQHLERLTGPPSGRTWEGYAFGIAGLLAMFGAALYSWRRRYIAAASRPIRIAPEQRRDQVARERAALEQLQALARQLTRNPNEDLRKIRAEAKRILKTHRVRRSIHVRVDSGRGHAPRLDVGRKEWGGRLRSWYLAHLSLGVLALVLITLHAGFRFGNVLAVAAYLCLVGVVLTGALGIYLYGSIPPALTKIEERAHESPEELAEELEQVIQELDQLTQGKSEGFLRVYQQEVSIPGIDMTPSLRWVTLPATIARDTARPDRLRLVVKEIPPNEQEDFRKTMRLIFRKEKIEVSLYPQLRYAYLLKAWLTLHIPLSAGLWAFSALHVAAVFWY